MIGICFDGTGYGVDGAIWGGEFLTGDFSCFERAAYFRYVPMPGGNTAIRQPSRMGLAHLVESVLAARTYQPDSFEFGQGRRTSTDVLQAAAQLADAQSREVGALAQYEVFRVDIAFATGTLIGQGQVLLPPSDAGDDLSKPTATLANRRWKRRAGSRRIGPTDYPESYSINRTQRTPFCTGWFTGT